MSILEQYNLTIAELGLSEFESELEKHTELVETLAKATLFSRESHEAYLSWTCEGMTKKEFRKEDSNRKYKYIAAEYEREKALDSLKMAIMGEDEFLELKQKQQDEIEEEYERELQKDYDGFYEKEVFDGDEVFVE